MCIGRIGIQAGKTLGGLHVDSQQGATPAGALRLDHGLRQAIQQQAAVGQVGQNIKECEAFPVAFTGNQLLAGQHGVIGRKSVG